MLQLIESRQENIIAAKIKGKITKADVDKVHLLVDDIASKYKKIDFYFEMSEFEGYTLKGLWEDIKIDISHMKDYGKIAIVGEKELLKWPAYTTNYFIDSEVKFFRNNEKELAKNWIAN